MHSKPPMAAVITLPAALHKRRAQVRNDSEPAQRGPIDLKPKLADVVLLKPAHRLDLFFGSITGVAW